MVEVRVVREIPMSAIAKTKTVSPRGGNLIATLWWRVLAPFHKGKGGTEYEIPDEAMANLLHELKNPTPAPERCVQSLREVLKNTNL